MRCEWRRCALLEYFSKSAPAIRAGRQSVGVGLKHSGHSLDLVVVSIRLLSVCGVRVDALIRVIKWRGK